jgi:hypothetical protein
MQFHFFYRLATHCHLRLSIGRSCNKQPHRTHCAHLLCTIKGVCLNTGLDAVQKGTTRHISMRSHTPAVSPMVQTPFVNCLHLDSIILSAPTPPTLGHQYTSYTHAPSHSLTHTHSHTHTHNLYTSHTHMHSHVLIFHAFLQTPFAGCYYGLAVSFVLSRQKFRCVLF